MTVRKSRVFEKISTTFASNEEVITRCSNSSFFQLTIPMTCFIIFSTIIFSNFHGGTMHNDVEKVQALVCEV